MTNKFKVGDRVKLTNPRYYHTKGLRGWTGTLKHNDGTSDQPWALELDRPRPFATPCNNPDRYGKAGHCLWVDATELEPLQAGPVKIVIKTDGKTTTAKMYDDTGAEMETACAKCNPSDLFDFLTGSRLAFDRMLAEARKPKLYNGRVLCTQARSRFFTTGKVYEVKDGQLTDDAGDRQPGCICENLESLQRHMLSRFAEVKSEHKPPADLYTGKVLCLSAGASGLYKAGEVYHIVNGRMFCDGEWHKRYADIKSFDHFQGMTLAKFAEIKED